jgi:poly-beta-1,6-N-acetyl-D-glucosamine synthase
MPVFQLKKNSDYLPFLTIIIPVRNESLHIEALLRDLNAQTYPKEYFEVLVIDDASEDDTAQKVLQMSDRVGYSLQLISLDLPADYKGSHKKQSITIGVEKSRGELLICTDGDCRVQKNWLALFAGYFEAKQAEFVSGGVSFIKENSLFEHMQTIEFASLLGIGAASMALQKPNMCNGANMAFRKEAFYKVHGYEDVEHIASGDDEFLMKKIFKRFPDGVHFLKSSQHVVYTYTKSDWKSFYQQRKRWAGKWKYHKDWKLSALAVGVFMFHLLFIAFFMAAIISAIPLGWFIALFGMKFFAEYLFLSRILKTFQKPVKLRYFIPLQLIYSFYVIIFGMAANSGSYEWKGRSIKN